MIWFFLFFIVVNGRLHLIILFCFIRITRIIKTHRQHLILISVLPSKYRYFSDKKEWNNRIGYSLAGRLRIRIRIRRRCLRLFKRFWTGSRVSSGRRKWSWRLSACSSPARPHLSTSSPYVLSWNRIWTTPDRRSIWYWWWSLLRCARSPRATWPSSYGILAVNRDSVPCGNDTVVASTPSCKPRQVAHSSIRRRLIVYIWFVFF